MQVRRAQKKYRLKKETDIESHKNRVVELENKLERLAESFSRYQESAQLSSLQGNHPELYSQLSGLRGQLAPELERLDRAASTHKISSEKDEDYSMLGYQVLGHSAAQTTDLEPTSKHIRNRTPTAKSVYNRGENLESPTYPGVRDTERLFGTNVPITCNFFETTFPWRIQRYCLEYASRIFNDCHSDPATNFRLFRLVLVYGTGQKCCPSFGSSFKLGSKRRWKLWHSHFIVLEELGHIVRGRTSLEI